MRHLVRTSITASLAVAALVTNCAEAGSRQRAAADAGTAGIGGTASQVVDSDGDGYPDGDEGWDVLTAVPAPARPARQPRSPGSPTSPGPGLPPCMVISETPFPYCNSGSSTALAYRPATAPLVADQLFFLTQTTQAEDIVWLDTADAATELDRCCPQSSITIGGMTHNQVFDCGSLDTLFVANVTTGSGTIREIDVLGGSPTSVENCTTGGGDELACSSGGLCTQRRSFNFAGLSAGTRVEAMTIIDGPFSSTPLLVVSTISKLHFVDPTSPSCGSAAVDVIGTCTIIDPVTSATVLIHGLASPGGDDLLVAERTTGTLYRVAVTQSGAIFSCDVVDSCMVPAATSPDALTFDPAAQVMFVGDRDSDTIVEMTPP